MATYPSWCMTFVFAVAWYRSSRQAEKWRDAARRLGLHLNLIRDGLPYQEAAKKVRWIVDGEEESAST